MSAKLVSIIGPPAAGKTTLAEFLAEELPAGLIREDYAGNPFLADSYVGPEAAKLPGQLYFLLSRVKQLSESAWPAEGTFVSDYGFCQDRIYAERKLGRDDLRLYDRVARRVEGLVHPPDLLIALDASERTLLARIAGRGRDFERAMDAAFLADMRKAYRAAADGAAAPVLRVDGDRRDLRDAAVRAELAERIRTELCK